MAKGVLYLMSTAVPGLVKIGKTTNFQQRMRELEHNGYRNVASLKREFAIEVDDFDEKEDLLHSIFEKSRVSDTELFALNKDIVIQLLSSLEGSVIYPKTETKEEIFEEATDNVQSGLIPNGTYTLKRKKVADNNRQMVINVLFENGNWTLLKDSVIGTTDDGHGSKKRITARSLLQIDENGVLLEDVALGNCSPSFVASLAANQSINGWDEWKNKAGQPISIYRKRNKEVE